MAGSRAPMRFAAVALALARWGFAPARAGIPAAHPGAASPVARRHADGHRAARQAARAVSGDAQVVMTVAPAMRRSTPRAPTACRRAVRSRAISATFAVAAARPRFDLAILPADNRWSWLARALGVRWIVGIAGDRPAHKNWPVDEPVPYSRRPTAFAETAAIARSRAGAAARSRARTLAGAGGGRRAGRTAADYAVLHVGASSPLKLWPAARWQALATALEVRGLDVVWSAGPGETAILDAIDAEPRTTRASPGRWRWPAVWHVLAGARLLVCPDTGIGASRPHRGRADRDAVRSRARR